MATNHGWQHRLGLVLLPTLSWCCLTKALCAKLLIVSGRPTNPELLLVLHRDGEDIHNTAELWQFMGHTLHLALHLCMQPPPSNSFMAGLGSLSAEEQ